GQTEEKASVQVTAHHRERLDVPAGEDHRDRRSVDDRGTFVDRDAIARQQKGYAASVGAQEIGLDNANGQQEAADPQHGQDLAVSHRQCKAPASSRRLISAARRATKKLPAYRSSLTRDQSEIAPRS